MAQLQIYQFPCLSDNYGVLIHDSEQNLTASIDAPEEKAIVQALDEKGWSLTHIFNTHHHFDHTGANEALKAKYSCEIIGPKGEADKIPGIDRTVGGGDEVFLGAARAKIIDTPGHTLGHIAYWFEGEKLAFVGDTLFALGCGRIFEGDARMMWTSLSKLAALPADTMIYCGHEYTMGNAEFSLTIEPENEALQRRVEEIRALRAENKPTVPTQLGVELETNPFLRPNSVAVQNRLNMVGEDLADVFGEIRARKDKA